ncbi:MAG: tetratricopeptide repeat protein, partial [Desulfobacterales bacterium]
SLVIQGYLGNYSHVYALLFYKLKFLGVLPENAGSLPFEAKAMWTSAFVSPQLIELPLMLASSLVFGPIGAGIILLRWFKKEARSYELMIALLASWMFIFFLLIHRMSVFAVFFLALSMGALTLVKKKQIRYALFAVLGAALLIQIYLQPSFGLHAFRPHQSDVNDLMSFIAAQTEKDAAVLTTFELGPAVAAYTGRPVILHSKFESKLLRDKVKQVYSTLYQGEQQFFELCRLLKADLFVYQVNMVLSSAPGSMRYLANAIPLESGSAAFMFHFLPDRLKHFSLVYQNPTYRLYRLAAPTASAGPPHLQYEPVYDLTIFSAEEDPGRLINDEIIKDGLSKLRYADTHLKVGDRFFASKDYQTAARQYQNALTLDPGNKRAAWSFAGALILAGEAEKSEEVLRAAVTMDPNYDTEALDISDADALIFLGREALQSKQFIKSQILFEKALVDQPGSEEAHFGLGLALWRDNKLAAAESAFQKVVAINPESHQAFEYLGKIYAARDDLVNAVACVKKSLELNPSQADLEKIYHLLQNRLANKKDTEDRFEFYFKSGILKAKDGELQEALDMFLIAAEVKKTASLLYNMGLVSHRMQKNDDAAAYLKESLAINPTDINSKSLLKYILGRQMNVVIGDVESKAD